MLSLCAGRWQYAIVIGGFIVSMSFVFGILLVVVGCTLVIKTEWWLGSFGPIQWAEEHLGTEGGSRLMYKCIGLICIFVGFLLVTGLFGGFLEGTLGRIFPRAAL